MIPRRVLVLTSDTGAGHRSVSRALAEAARERPDSPLELVEFDPFGPPPAWLACRRPAGRMPALDRLVALYGPAIVRAPWLWGWVYQAFDNGAGLALALALFGRAVRERIAAAVEHVEAAAVLSVHPVVNHAMSQARRHLGRRSLPLMTVLTDLVSVHRFWACAAVDQYVASSAAAAGRLHDLGIPPPRIATLGIPLRRAFGRTALSAREMRLRVGLDPDRHTIVLMGGGDGAGRLADTARAIAAIGPRVGALQLVVLTGRNAGARRALGAAAWPVPARVHGFVENIHEYMTAADVIVTKPGSVTVAEALALARPLVLGRPVPGQEEGTVGYVVEGGAGLAYRTPAEAAEAVAYLLGDPSTRWEMGQRAARLSHPHATERTLDLLQALVLRAEAGGHPR